MAAALGLLALQAAAQPPAAQPPSPPAAQAPAPPSPTQPVPPAAPAPPEQPSGQAPAAPPASAEQPQPPRAFHITDEDRTMMLTLLDRIETLSTKFSAESKSGKLQIDRSMLDEIAADVQQVKTILRK